MRAERRNAIVLGLLAVLLLAIVGYQLRATRLDGSPAAAGGTGRDRQARNGTVPAAPDVHLDALKENRPKPESAARNPFRFKPKPPPPPPPAPKPTTGATPGGEPRPGGPPPPPPISNTIKFIGIVEAPGRRVAVLSDGRHVYYGREGEAVLGQYRILRIGAESIEMAYLDGRGRQTIRLSGS